jgi:fatty-acyl-CoA synthase
MSDVSLAHRAADTSVPLLDLTIGDLLDRQIAIDPEAVASRVLEQGTLTTRSYGDLAQSARAVGRGLLTRAEPGDRVAVWGPNSDGWIVAQHAIAAAGLVLVPVNPALTDAEVGHILDDSGAVTLLAAEEFRGSALRTRANALATGLPALRHVASLNHLVAELATSGDRLPRVDPRAVALIQYTSGTTGRPKGAVLTHHAIVNAAHLATARLQPTDHEVWCTPLPLHHVGASVCATLPPLTLGGSFALLDSWDPSAALRLISESRATFFGGVPTMMLDLLALPGIADADLSSLRVVQTGGSSVPPSLVRRIEAELGVRVVVAYGQSEAPVSVMCALDDSEEVKAESLGRVLPHREVRIIDSDGETVLEGARGELCLRSPLNMTGYWGQPELTKATLDSDGWLHTGDVCSMDRDGIIRIHGRVRDVIIRGGENVYPAEVEDVLLQHPAVMDVAVVGRPDERWGEEVAAFVRLAPDCETDAAALEAYAREHLAAFKVPRHWRFVDAFPLTASGKVKKHELAALLRD